MSVIESVIVRDILKYLNSLPGCFAWKHHGGMYSTAGVPDVICCYRGKFIAFEVKGPKGQPTKLQLKTMQDIQAAGGQAYVVRSLGEVRRIVKQPNKTKGG